MNILLVNYGDAENNSAYHIFGFAKGLADLGHDVVVAVSKYPADLESQMRDGFRVNSHRKVLALGSRFRNGLSADILHLWTPRETMRQFSEAYMKSWCAWAVLIHLEDNEESIFERFTGCTVADAAGMEQEWGKGLIHPRHYRTFLNCSQGVTLVHRCLEPLVPRHLPRQEIVPVIDPAFFAPGPRNEGLLEKLGIPMGARVIVYNGNDHAAACRDIRRLYETVDLLVERGHDVYLVRTGHVMPTSYDGLQFRPGSRCIELGFVARSRIPEIMQMADVFIQPGDADAFNAFRLPAKVPEYLSLGIPLIVGSGNISLELATCSAAMVLPMMTAQSMANAVEWQWENARESAMIGARGRHFALNRFSASIVVPALESYYAKILALDGLCVTGGITATAKA